MRIKSRYLILQATNACVIWFISCYVFCFTSMVNGKENKQTISIEWSIYNAFTSTFYHPFDGPLGLGWGGVFYDSKFHHENNPGVMTLSSNKLLSDQNVGQEYWHESGTSFFNIVTSINLSEWMVSAMPFSVDLVEYKDKFDNQQLISSDGYYSVPTGNKTTINAFYYSATYPFADAKKNYSGGLSYNTYDNKISLVIGMRL